jgi:hypothetical protein
VKRLPWYVNRERENEQSLYPYLHTNTRTHIRKNIKLFFFHDGATASSFFQAVKKVHQSESESEEEVVEKRDSIAEGNEEEDKDVMDDEQDDNDESYLQGEEGDRIRQLEKQLKMLEEGMSLDAASAAGNLDQLELQLQDDEEEEYGDNGDNGDQEVVGDHRFITNDEVQALYLPDNNWYDAIILNRHHDEETGAPTYDIQFVGFEGDEGYEENKPAEEVASIQEYSGDEEGEGEWDEEGEEGEISQ